MAPDGNGGLYRAVVRSGVLGEMKSAGVRYLHVYCVDNVLVRVADPAFIGFCVSRRADCGAKVVEKTDPHEPVGVVCRLEGEGPRVVEYSEISEKIATLRDSETGKLRFRAGNICNHFFTTEFLSNVSTQNEDDLVHHVAKKKIPFVNDEAQPAKPTAPNGIKMEKFVFDVFAFSKNGCLRKFVVWETRREGEFSPLKNAEIAGKDCAKTCRNDLYRLHAEWIAQAGGTVDSSGTEDPPTVEISPSVSYGGEGLEKLVGGKCIKPPVYLKGPNYEPQVNGNA